MGSPIAADSSVLSAWGGRRHPANPGNDDTRRRCELGSSNVPAASQGSMRGDRHRQHQGHRYPKPPWHPEPALGRRPRRPRDLELLRRQRVSARGTVDEVDMVALETDGTMQVMIAAGCRCSPKRAMFAVRAALRRLSIRSATRGRAVERHAQIVVELAEVRILHDLAAITGRVEIANANSELHDDVGDQCADEYLQSAKEERLADLARGGASRSTPGVASSRRALRRAPVSPLPGWPRDRPAVLDQGAERGITGVTGATTSERIRPCAAGMSSQRQVRPLKSGRVPAAAGGTANRPSFIAASAQASPPPENIANDTFFDGPNRATRTSSPRSRTTDRNECGAHLQAQIVPRPGGGCRECGACTPASWLEMAKLAPSPPKTNGNCALQRVGDRGDDRCPGGVHRLVAARGDGLVRAHDVGQAHQPIVGQRPILPRIHDVRESFEDRHADRRIQRRSSNRQRGERGKPAATPHAGAGGGHGVRPSDPRSIITQVSSRRTAA